MSICWDLDYQYPGVASKGEGLKKINKGVPNLGRDLQISFLGEEYIHRGTNNLRSELGPLEHHVQHKICQRKLV